MAEMLKFDVHIPAFPPAPAEQPAKSELLVEGLQAADGTAVDPVTIPFDPAADTVSDAKLDTLKGSSVTLTINDYDAAGNKTANVADPVQLADTTPLMQRGSANATNVVERSV